MWAGVRPDDKAGGAGGHEPPPDAARHGRADLPNFRAPVPAGGEAAAVSPQPGQVPLS